MTRYVVQRLLWTAPVLLAIAALTFALMHQVPGGPWDGGKQLSEQARENRDETYALNEPVWEQFGLYLQGLVRGDLGISFQGDRPVREVLAEKAAVSAMLGGLALVLSVSVGMALGIASALNRDRWPDRAGVAFATVAASVPSFILGMLLLVVLSANLHWLPSGGWGSPQQAVMPVLALSALPAAYIARITRASMLDVTDEDYVRTARAKGLGERAVVLRHMLRNALVPVLTVIGPIAAVLITGSFVVEELFAIPGLGREFVTAVGKRDYGLIMGATLFYATVVVLANLIVDVLCALIDPRIREQMHG
jgi:oligopeptide transport system permease protein